MPPIDEDALLRRIRGGDLRAFGALVDQYKGMVFNLAARMLGRPELAEDLSQEVFMRVWKGVATFRGECRLSTWIYRITLNLCIAEAKTARSRAQYLQVDDPVTEALPQFHAESDNPYAEEVILKDRMSSLIPQMPEKYRIAVSLFYLKEMSYVEISEIMDVPIGTVKSYLFRGKAWLRERLLGNVPAEED